jgi:hypothetical protein
MVVSPQRAAAQDPRATIRGEAAAAPAPFLKELYFYLSFSNDALQNLFDPDIIVKNATTDFPVVEGMSGVAFAIQWSQLCPVENQCNFAIIDRCSTTGRPRAARLSCRSPDFRADGKIRPGRT